MKTKRTKKTPAIPKPQVEKPVQLPDPAKLLEEAKNQPRIITARDYIETINTLRHEKSFSFREIAEWLNARGVPLDNNEIYRAYMADMKWEEKQALQHQGAVPDPED